MLKTHYWRANTNFGEMLIPIIVKWISGHDIEYVYNDVKGKYLIIGSEMSRNVLQENDIVWGYGNRYSERVKVPESANILAVRGELTWESMDGDVPRVFGDPSILMPLIYTPKQLERRYDIGIITHHTDRHLFKKINDPNILLLDIFDDPYLIIDKLNSCDIVISSSLHACIVAESYDIPVIWMLGSKDKRETFQIKFADYFSGTERDRNLTPTIFLETDICSIAKNSIDILPKGVFHRQELIKAWDNYHKKL